MRLGKGRGWTRTWRTFGEAPGHRQVLSRWLKAWKVCDLHFIAIGRDWNFKSPSQKDQIVSSPHSFRRLAHCWTSHILLSHDSGSNLDPHGMASARLGAIMSQPPYPC